MIKNSFFFKCLILSILFTGCCLGTSYAQVTGVAAGGSSAGPVACPTGYILCTGSWYRLAYSTTSPSTLTLTGSTNLVPGQTYRLSFDTATANTGGYSAYAVTSNTNGTFSIPLPSSQSTTKLTFDSPWDRYTTTFTVPLAVTSPQFIVTYNGSSASGFFYVANIELAALASQSITAVSSAPNITIGATSTVSVTGGSGSGAVTYSSSDTAVATVNANSGVVTGVGAGTVTITATKAADNTYSSATSTTIISVSPPVSNVATLSSMTMSSGILSPTFASGTNNYTLSVTNATASITVTPTVTQANAIIAVNGTAVPSGSATNSIALGIGINTITAVVTAQDGTTTRTYTTTVTRADLLAQATFTVGASPTTLNATTTSSTLSSSGGSGTGAVSYAVTSGSCTVSGSTLSAGVTSSETCTVTGTKASDGTYAAATATVNITVARRANISAAATDASVLAIHGAQIMQSQKFVTTQIENVANHLNSYRNNFNLRPSTFGFGVNLPSLGPASQALYKIKDELTPRPEMQAQNTAQSKETKSGMKKMDYVEEQERTTYNDYMREEELAAEKIKQEKDELEKVQQYASSSIYQRESLTYSVWTAGTIDYANYKTGDNKETQNKLTANGLTMGIDYKLHDAAIVGAAVGVGTAWQSAVAINTNLKAKQTAVTGYSIFGFADHWVVEGLMGYGVVDFSGNRTTSDGAGQLVVNRKGETYFSSGTVSKKYWVEGYKVTPFVRQDVMHINLHSYAETGAADYALGFDSTNFMHTTTSGGLQVSRDIFFEGAKLTPTAKIALNRIRTGGLAQNIYYADTGAAGGVYTLNQSGSYMTTQSLGLGLVYTTRAGDGFDMSWQGTIGANQYKVNGLRFAVRFAM